MSKAKYYHFCLYLYYFVFFFWNFVRIVSFFCKLKGWCSVLPDLNMPSLPEPDLPPLSAEEIQIINEKIETRKRIERWIKIPVWGQETSRGQRWEGLPLDDRYAFHPFLWRNLIRTPSNLARPSTERGKQLLLPKINEGLVCLVMTSSLKPSTYSWRT